MHPDASDHRAPPPPLPSPPPASSPITMVPGCASGRPDLCADGNQCELPWRARPALAPVPCTLHPADATCSAQHAPPARYGLGACGRGMCAVVCAWGYLCVLCVCACVVIYFWGGYLVLWGATLTDHRMGQYAGCAARLPCVCARVSAACLGVGSAGGGCASTAGVR